MSLVGSLEDLGLGDILQIVSLSRKSGLLLLRSGGHRGRIVLIDGHVRGGSVEGGPSTLREVLVDPGHLSAEDWKAAEEQAAAEGAGLESVLAGLGLAAERLESLRREQVEAAVLTMFGWRVGEFSFEMRDEVEPADAELLTASGINAQYLAMEATRLGDEAFPGDPGEDEPMFSGEEPADAAAGAEPLEASDPDAYTDPFQASDPDAHTDPFQASDSDAYTDPFPADSDAYADSLEASDADADVDPLEASDPDALGACDPDAQTGPLEAPQASSYADAFESPDPAPGDAHEPLLEAVPVEEEPAQAEPAPAAGPPRPLVAIDPELVALEWLKSSLGGVFSRIHIFQSIDGGIGRVRQYLSRGQRPVVLLSTRLEAEGGVNALVRRLRGLAPGMTVLVLDDGRGEADVPDADARMERPPAYRLSSRAAWQKVAAQAQVLREALQPWASPQPEPATAGRPSADAARLDELKSVSARLQAPDARGEVLKLVLDYAAQTLSRVAIFMVREDRALGVAQVHLDRAGGPGDALLRRIALPIEASSWLRAAFESGEAQRGAPENTGDRRLAELLGDQPPAEAYVAPIQSGGEVAALLYGDNLPAREPIGDTTALEIVLHEAGLALDRALLERALAEAEAG